jgi:hypothetical protein
LISGAGSQLKQAQRLAIWGHRADLVWNGAMPAKDKSSFDRVVQTPEMGIGWQEHDRRCIGSAVLEMFPQICLIVEFLEAP